MKEFYANADLIVLRMQRVDNRQAAFSSQCTQAFVAVACGSGVFPVT